jgi:polar amino acid transport system substrate-binding protein
MVRSRRSLSVMAVAGIAALALTACGGADADEPAAESIVPAEFVGALKDKVPAEFADGLTVATQADIAPLTYTTDDGDVVGFDQDMLAALEAVLGVDITVEPVTFENLILGLESGTYDFVGDTTIKKERLEKYDMLTYLTSSNSVATLASADKLGDEETAICGLEIGIVSGELSGDYVRNTVDPLCEAAGLDPVSLTEYKDFASTVLAVRSENVLGMLVDTMTFGYFQSGESGGDFAFNGPSRLTETSSGYSFLKTQNQELAVVVQEALSILIDEVVYAELLGKYGQDVSGIEGDPVLNPVPTI